MDRQQPYGGEPTKAPAESQSASPAEREPACQAETAALSADNGPPVTATGRKRAGATPTLYRSSGIEAKWNRPNHAAGTAKSVRFPG